MRFINISPVQKITEIVNFLVKSRKFSFGLIVAVALLSVGVTLIQNFIVLKGLPSVPVSPLASALSESRALGVASESAEPVQNIVSDTKPPMAVKNIENKGIGTTTPAKTSDVQITQKVVNVTANAGRINFPNNKFGIYSNNIGGEIDLAAELVNSNGGDWGWVLVPMPMGTNDTGGWNDRFGKLAAKHLIPVIQLIEPNASGKVPTEEEIDNIAKFLGSLNWPTKIRAVTAFNEVNASEYWGGKIDPEGYARILNRLIDQLKAQSSEFFVMNGALNASARTGSLADDCITTDLHVKTCYQSEIVFLQRMNTAVPGIFKKLDGWASHTYPHNGRSYEGPPAGSSWGAETGIEVGRNSIVSYKFEQKLLQRDYGVSLPIFITETGWPHQEGQVNHNEWLPSDTVASYYNQVFTKYFLPDRSVVAVMPFLLSGSGDPSNNFSFTKSDGAKYPQWDVLVSIKKTAGNPPR